MTQRIVIGLDGSDASVAALSWAADEARLRDAELAVWTITDRPPGDENGATGEFETSRSALLEVTGGYPVEVHRGHSDAAAGLVSACVGADLLVVGCQGRGRWPGRLLGSVGRVCLSHAPCPVVVVGSAPERTPAESARHGRVLVGIDMSGHSRAALQIAAEEARLRAAQLHLIHAVHWDSVGTELITPTEQQLIDWGRRLEATELAATGVTGVTLHPVIVHGHPADVLVHHSADADLLVLGSHGRNPLSGLLLGSVSDHCAQHAHCPVMIVRPAGRTEHDHHQSAAAEGGGTERGGTW